MEMIMKYTLRLCYCFFLSVLLFCTTGCVSRSRIVTVPSRPKTEYLQDQISKAQTAEQDKKQSVDQLDHWLRVVSMALDVGDVAYAREVLVKVTDGFASMMSEKNFVRRERQALALIGGKEKKKYFLGDPYEQLMAYLYLGMLDFQAGEYDLARASFRSASLADEGSTLDGYKSDCYFALLMEGVASIHMGERDMAEEAFRIAEQAYAFRQNMPMLTEAFYQTLGDMFKITDNKKDIKRLDKLFSLCYGNLPAALSVNSDLEEALVAVFDGSRRELEAPEKDSPANEYLKSCNGKNDVALKLLDNFEAGVLSAVAPNRVAQIALARKSFEALIEQCENPETNLFVIQQIGQSPSKIRRGKYGQEVSFYTHPDPVERTITTLRRDDNMMPTHFAVSTHAESIDYQAKTRGGREMDHVLKGKAQFRDAMNISSAVASGVGTVATVAAVSAATTMVTTTTTTAYVTAQGTIATATTTSVGPAGAAAAGPLIAVAATAIALKFVADVFADATHPEGDIRGWHELPRQMLFMCGTVNPGDYNLVSRSFDALGRAAPDNDLHVRFVTSKDRPTLLLCRTPWR